MLVLAARGRGDAGPSAAVVFPPPCREPTTVPVACALHGSVPGGVGRHAGAAIVIRPDANHGRWDVPGPDAIHEALNVGPRTRRPLVARVARGCAPGHGDDVRPA